MREVEVANPKPMKYFVLSYTVVADYIERRREYRAAHLELARAAAIRGELRLGGALADPADTAVLVFRGLDSSVAEAFARADPYVENGLVTSWSVREWTVVIGADYAAP
jgi:uncharacterized protein YciI